MPTISAPQEFNEEDLYVDLDAVLGIPLHLKCEGFNFTGSVKQKAALEMVEAAEEAGRLSPGSVLVESSSGNLGVALSVIAASKGYRFVCVTDSRCNLASKRLMEALGATVHTLAEPAPEGASSARGSPTYASCARKTRGTSGSTSTSTPPTGGRITDTRPPASTAATPASTCSSSGRGPPGP